MSEYSIADLPMCRDRERQQIAEALRIVNREHCRVERERIAADLDHLRLWAANRAAVRERLAKGKA